MTAKNIHSAMVEAQAQFPTVGFDRTNPAFKSKYTSLTAIVEAVRPILNECGCYLTHNSKLTERGVWVQTRIVHGESQTEIVTETELPLEAPTPQKLGGALTYGRRYTLGLALGLVCDDDDDGESIQPRPQAQRPAVGNPLGVNGKVAPQPAVAPPSQYELEVLAAWDGSAVKAQEWAVAEGACENIHEAKNSMRKIVDADFGGEYNTANKAAVLLAYLRHQVDKLAQKVVAANGA